MSEGGSTWAEQTDAEERAAATADGQVLFCVVLSLIIDVSSVYYCLGFVLY